MKFRGATWFQWLLFNDGDVGEEHTFRPLATGRTELNSNSFWSSEIPESLCGRGMWNFINVSFACLCFKSQLSKALKYCKRIFSELDFVKNILNLEMSMKIQILTKIEGKNQQGFLSIFWPVLSGIFSDRTRNGSTQKSCKKPCPYGNSKLN